MDRNKLEYMKRLVNAINDESLDNIRLYAYVCDYEAKIELGWPNPNQ